MQADKKRDSAGQESQAPLTKAVNLDDYAGDTEDDELASRQSGNYIRSIDEGLDGEEDKHSAEEE
ncbi:MAG TPA: hypothetical protein VFR58_06705 [Flavisolibacter sp.]|nr:hypothetical protein [Flavisolibacter sp.]